jgi:hypothetical protein
MNVRIRAAVTVCLLTMPALAVAQTVDITLRKTTKGDKVLVTKEETGNSRIVLKGPDDKILSDDSDKPGSSSGYVEETLEKEGTKPATRLRRVYEKASVTRDGKTTTLPYQGKTVLIEKKDGKYVFSVDGKELTGDDVRVLTREFADKKETDKDFGDLFLPGKAVAVNETWKLDVVAIGRLFYKDDPMALDAAKAGGTGKLLKVYRKDGRQWGVMEFKLDLPFSTKTFDAGLNKITYQPGSGMNLTITLDACIDGTASLGTMKVDVALSGTATYGPEGKESKMILKVEGTIRETHEEPAR